MLKIKFAAILAFCSIFFLPTHCLHAWSYEPFIDISLGYRQDKITCQSMSYEANGEILSQNNLIANNLRLIEVGATGGLAICENWLLLADLAFGKVLEGDYSEQSIDFGLSKISGKIASGDSQDISLSAGYCPCFFSCVRFGPVVGWSYHALETTMRHLPISSDAAADTHHVTYKNQWQGPWAGVTVSTSFWRLAIYSDYEYHWPHWEAAWTPSGPDIFGTTFADRRRANHGNGQVFRVGVNYSLCGEWTIGIRGKYQVWKAHDGSIIPRSGSFSDVGSFLVDHDKVIQARWRSVEGQITLGYQF